MLPDTDFETDTEKLSPSEAHDRWESVTNLDADELRDVQESEVAEGYVISSSGSRRRQSPTVTSTSSFARHAAQGRSPSTVRFWPHSGHSPDRVVRRPQLGQLIPTPPRTGRP